MQKVIQHKQSPLFRLQSNSSIPYFQVPFDKKLTVVATGNSKGILEVQNMKALAQCVTKISAHNIVNMNYKICIKYHFFPVLCFQVVTVYHQLPDAYEDSTCNSFQLNVAIEKTGAVLALF